MMLHSARVEWLLDGLDPANCTGTRQDALGALSLFRDWGWQRRSARTLVVRILDVRKRFRAKEFFGRILRLNQYSVTLEVLEEIDRGRVTPRLPHDQNRRTTLKTPDLRNARAITVRETQAGYERAVIIHFNDITYVLGQPVSESALPRYYKREIPVDFASAQLSRWSIEGTYLRATLGLIQTPAGGSITGFLQWPDDDCIISSGAAQHQILLPPLTNAQSIEMTFDCSAKAIRVGMELIYEDCVIDLKEE